MLEVLCSIWGVALQEVAALQQAQRTAEQDHVANVSDMLADVEALRRALGDQRAEADAAAQQAAQRHEGEVSALRARLAAVSGESLGGQVGAEGCGMLLLSLCASQMATLAESASAGRQRNCEVCMLQPYPERLSSDSPGGNAQHAAHQHAGRAVGGVHWLAAMACHMGQSLSFAPCDAGLAHAARVGRGTACLSTSTLYM